MSKKSKSQNASQNRWFFKGIFMLFPWIFTENDQIRLWISKVFWRRFPVPEKSTWCNGFSTFSRVGNDVNPAGNSRPFDGTFCYFSRKSLPFWSTVYSGINLIFDPRNIKFSIDYEQKVEVAKRLSESLIFQRYFHAFSLNFHWKWPNSPMNFQGFLEAFSGSGKVDLV